MILFSAIHAIIPVIPVVPIEVSIIPDDPLVVPEVGAVTVTLPAGVLDLVDYSSFSDSDPSQDSLLLAPELPLVLPFLCFDDSKADNSSSERSLDSSSPSAGPYRKRCRSPTTLAVTDLGISDGVRVDTEDGIGMGVKIAASDIREDEEEFETAQRQLEAGQLLASEERANLTDKIMRFIGIVMMLRGDLGNWSRLLRGVRDSALSLVVPWLCRTFDWWLGLDVSSRNIVNQ
nr:hypothetical protein [Tanacetum cinerariifolium]